MLRQRERALRDHRRCSAFDRLRDEVVTVGMPAPQRNENAPGTHLARIHRQRIDHRVLLPRNPQFPRQGAQQRFQSVAPSNIHYRRFVFVADGERTKRGEGMVGSTPACSIAAFAIAVNAGAATMEP